MELKDLVASRGYVKGIITRIVKFCRSELFQSATTEILCEKKARIEKAFADYARYNMSILALNPSDDEDYGSVEDSLDDVISRVNAIVKQVSGSSANQAQGSSSQSGELKKLPPINIKPFNGSNIVDYYPFINMFKSVIDSDSSLSLCTKLYYLRSLLSGEALDIIQNLMLINENYERALELLDKRYNNIPKIINYHVNSILDLPAIPKCTAQGLRQIISNVNMHLAALKNLGQNVEEWDTLLINILVKKIDIYTYRGFHMEQDIKRVPKLSAFLDYLEKRAVVLESTNEVKPTRVYSCSHMVSQVPCTYCKKPHRLYQCSQFKMLANEDRVNFVNNNNLCKLCLNMHQGKCLMTFKCAICRQPHNTLLHLTAKSVVTDVTTNDPIDPNVNIKASANVNNVNNDIASSNHVAKRSDSLQYPGVLLPTAMVKIQNKDGSYTNVRALLDSGSQVSFIKEELLNNAVCKQYDTDEVVSGVGDGTNCVSKKADILICSSTNDFEINVSCCVTKNITCPLPQEAFNRSQLNIPSHIKLADRKFNIPSEISIILGCDILFQVLQCESLVLAPHGPHLVNSLFGYVVAGSLPASTTKIKSCNFCITS